MNPYKGARPVLVLGGTGHYGRNIVRSLLRMGRPVKTIRFRRIPLLPLRIASIVTSPFNPFLRHLLQVLALRDHFPQDLAAG